MKKLQYFILFILIYLFVINCEYTPISMPNSNDSTKLFSTGEIKYIAMNPSWDNFSKPLDIFISIDDYIFIADSGKNQITVLNKTGDIILKDQSGNDFSALSNLNNISPIGLCVDSKLNVFFVDRSNTVYVWNQFINNCSNNEGNDSIAVAITYRNPETSDEIRITNFLDSYALDYTGYIIVNVEYEYNQAKMDSILGVHVFYKDYDKTSSEFVSIAASPLGSDNFYITDNYHQNIQNISFARSSYIKLADGTTLWQHQGYLNGLVATAGTGAGTINDPKGICTDDGGNIYYTQTGVNFGLHKISKSSDISLEWNSAFTLGKNPIMDLNRFNAPCDVAVDNNGNIFVLNSGDNEVQEFDNNGNFVRKAGLREAQFEITVIDTITTESGIEYIPRDTIITEYYNDILNKPKGIFVDDGVIYIVDTGNKNIKRFKLSSDLDIEIPE